ncbi:hypothetical protein DSECCO2_574550 [anaerobic digester metagenome]
MVTNFGRNDLIEDHPADSGCNISVFYLYSDPGVQVQTALDHFFTLYTAELLFIFISSYDVICTIEMAHGLGIFRSFAFGHGKVITTEYNVLVRSHGQSAVSRQEQVAGREHQHSGFNLRFQRKRDIYTHLVAVEVRVEGNADHGMQLDGFVVGKYRHEGLDTQTVQSGSAVQEYGVILHHVFQNAPDLRLFLFDEFLGVLDLVHFTHLLQSFDQIGLEKFHRHILGQAALV